MRVENTEFGGVQEPEIGPLTDHLSNLDQTRAQFQQAIADYGRLPTRHNNELLAATINDHATAFTKTARHIILSEDSTNEQKGKILATLINDDDSKRVDHLNMLTGSADFMSNAPIDSMAGYFKEQFDDIETDEEIDPYDKANVMFGGVFESFVALFQADVNELRQKVQTTKQAKFIRFGRAAAKHALEVGKIGAGVTLGVIAAKKIIRK